MGGDIGDIDIKAVVVVDVRGIRGKRQTILSDGAYSSCFDGA